jgi:hypothetical protein
MHFLRGVKGYTKLDKIRSEVIRKELGISGIHDVRSKHRQNWINRLERMDNTRHQKRSYKKRIGDLWNTIREIQTQTKLDQPS